MSVHEDIFARDCCSVFFHHFKKPILLQQYMPRHCLELMQLLCDPESIRHHLPLEQGELQREVTDLMLMG